MHNIDTLLKEKRKRTLVDWTPGNCFQSIGDNGPEKCGRSFSDRPGEAGGHFLRARLRPQGNPKGEILKGDNDRTCSMPVPTTRCRKPWR